MNDLNMFKFEYKNLYYIVYFNYDKTIINISCAKCYKEIKSITLRPHDNFISWIRITQKDYNNHC